MKDIQLRFKVAGAKDDQVVTSDSLTDFIAKAGQVPDDQLYILTTYTAMLALRKQLAAQGIVSAGF